MQLAEYREIANAKLNRLFRRIAMARRAGLPPPAALLDERRRLSGALGAIAYVEDITIKRRKTRIAELGIVHH